VPSYEGSITIDAQPEELFDFLSKIDNLPRYFSGITDAHSATGDEVHVTAQLPPQATPGPDSAKVEAYATFDIDADHKSLTWGTDNEHRYHGELQVIPVDGGSQLSVRLHTEHESDRIDQGIQDTLHNVAELVAERPGLQARARRPSGPQARQAVRQAVTVTNACE
jgi:carbon monoxide dehydrogenase subunit G